MLGRFDNVPDVQKYLQSGLQLVFNTEYAAFANAMTHLSNVKKENVLPMHFSVHDAAGRSIVVQIVNGKVEVLSNPLGVFANEPLLQVRVRRSALVAPRAVSGAPAAALRERCVFFCCMRSCL